MVSTISLARTLRKGPERTISPIFGSDATRSSIVSISAVPHRFSHHPDAERRCCGLYGAHPHPILRFFGIEDEPDPRDRGHHLFDEIGQFAGYGGLGISEAGDVAA